LDLKAPETERGRDTRIFVSYAGNKSVARRIEAGDSTLVALSYIIDGQDHELRRSIEEALKAMLGWDHKRVGAALSRFDRACNMLNQQIPCTTISEATDNEAVEVFSRLNKGGVALSQGDVRAAELAKGKAVVVLKKIRKFINSERPRRLGFGFSFAFRALVLFHTGSSQFSTLKSDWMNVPGPNGRSLTKSWGVTEQASDSALEFIDRRMGWSRRTLIPSTNAIIVLAAALEKGRYKIGVENELMYRRWLCLTALRGVFQGSVETTINHFHRAIRNSKGSAAEALVGALKKDVARRVRADEFNRFAQMWGPTTQIIHAWLVGQHAKDWLNEMPIDILARSGDLSFPGGDLTVHHIFPRKILADVNNDADYANCPANYALLSRSTNSEFGDSPPDEVLATLTSKQRSIASVQVFGNAAGDNLKTDRYEEFCRWRAKQLAAAINNWLEVG
jgi:hypothetical protein